MFYPPNGSRRTKLRRRVAVLTAGVLVLAVASGFAHWRAGGFPARSEQLAGTPVELRIQDGVTPRELHAIRGALRTVHTFMRKRLGRTVHSPVEARIARGDPCGRSRSGDESLIGEGRRGYLCVDTANVYWKSLVSNDPVAAGAIAGHEYVHTLQAELGCLPSRDEQRYHWIVEGMATHVAWRALVSSHRATEARVRRKIRFDGGSESARQSLQAYERGGGRTPQYAVWHLATRLLVAEAVKRDAAPPDRPELSLRRFCQRVGAGAPWRAAFERSFGLSVLQFYARFEAMRSL